MEAKARQPPKEEMVFYVLAREKGTILLPDSFQVLTFADFLVACHVIARGSISSSIRLHRYSSCSDDIHNIVKMMRLN